MQRDELLDHLDRELELLGRIRPDQLADEVTGCPGWDVGKLVDHVGRVHQMVLDCIAADDASAFPGFPGRTAFDGDELLAWIRDGSSALSDVLRRAPDEQAAASFLGPTTVSWWIRRQAHENAVHRWDAEAASGQATPVAPDLAADGVGEVLDLRTARGWIPPEGLRGSIHLHATDADGEWLLELGDTLTWRTGHLKGDAAVRGPVSDLYLMLWGRIPPARLEVLGDTELLERFLDAF